MTELKPIVTWEDDLPCSFGTIERNAFNAYISEKLAANVETDTLLEVIDECRKNFFLVALKEAVDKFNADIKEHAGAVFIFAVPLGGKMEGQIILQDPHEDDGEERDGFFIEANGLIESAEIKNLLQPFYYNQ